MTAGEQQWGLDLRGAVFGYNGVVPIGERVFVYLVAQLWWQCQQLRRIVWWSKYLAQVSVMDQKGMNSNVDLLMEGGLQRSSGLSHAIARRDVRAHMPGNSMAARFTPTATEVRVMTEVWDYC